MTSMRFLPFGDPDPTAVAVRRAVDGQRMVVRWRRSRSAVAEAALSNGFDDLGRLTRGEDEALATHMDWLVQACVAWSTANDDTPVPSLADAPRTPPGFAARVRELELTRGPARTAAALALADEVAAARLYVADADLVHVMLGAAEAMPDSPLLSSDAIDSAGLLWFAQPVALRSTVTLPDGHSNEFETRLAGLLWDDCTDAAGRPGLAVRMVILSSREALGIDMPGRPGVLVSDSTVLWPFGLTLEQAWDAYREEDPTGSRSKSLLMLWRLTATFWHLSRQKITAPSVVRPPKQVRANAARAGVRVPEEGITVIGLRHVEGSGVPAALGPRTRNGYSVRWAVRGHWRSQWYPSIAENRPVYIHPYLKGPDGAPLKDSTTVWVATGADLRDESNLEATPE